MTTLAVWVLRRLHFWGLRGDGARWYRRLALRKSLAWMPLEKEPWE